MPGERAHPAGGLSSGWRTRAWGRLPAYLALGGGGLLAAVLVGRPEPAVVVAPMLLMAALGLARARPPQLEVQVRLERERAVEGEEVELVVQVSARQAVSRLEVELQLPPGLRALAVEPMAQVGKLTAGGTRTFRRRIVCERWGGRLVGQLRLHTRDPLGLFTYEEERRHPLPLRVYPAPQTLRQLLRPVQTQVFAGNQVSRLKGDGIEFADIRPFMPGDRVRRINWRASARRGQLQVNQMHLERNADVVLFLDTFSDLADASGSSLELAVRGAAALADAYLRTRDRVGLVSFGGTLRWLTPQMGERQLYRLADALIDSEVVVSYAWKALEVIPRRTLPPKALVVALSPLLDERSLGALWDLRARGYELAVLEVSPLDFVAPGSRAPERLAYRLWRMEREQVRARFWAAGVPVVVWPRGEPIAAALMAAAEFRRRTRVAMR
jgi:uncharacterized protein (DUF58 family)